MDHPNIYDVITSAIIFFGVLTLIGVATWKSGLPAALWKLVWRK